MEKKSISKVIVSKGQAEAIAIRKEASIAGKQIETKIISDAKKQANKIVLDAKIYAETQLKAQEMNHELDKRKAMLVAKSRLMDELFNKAYEQIKSLSEKDFLDFIIKLLEAETYNGDEIIKVKADDHGYYQKLVPQINKKMNTNFTLSKDPIEIDSGFLIIGKYYDLNFDFMEIINLVRKKHETSLAEELFKD